MNQWLQLRTRIGTRLRLTYVTLLGLSLALAAVGLNRLEHLSKALDEVVREMVASQQRVQVIGTNAEVAARKLLVLIGAPRDGRVEAYTAIDAANKRLDDAVAGLHDGTPKPELQAALADIETRLKIYRTHYAATVDLIEADDFLAARRMLGGDTEAALSQLMSALQAFNDAEQHAIEARSEALTQLAQRDRAIVLGGGAVSLLLGFALAAVVTRSIVTPLARTTSGAKRIAAGHYDHRVETCEVDEVGRLGASLNQLAQAVGEREAARVAAAETETLTQLARRPRFLREAQALLGSLNRAGQLAVLVCMDVDRLKPINALLGFEAGDALLKALAARLVTAAGPGAVLGRLSGGAIVALLPIDDEAALPTRTAVLQTEIEHQLDWHGQAFDVSVTQGVALYPADGAGPQGVELLLRRAEQAMYEAKRQKLRCVRYDPTWETARQTHLSLLSDLRLAVEQDQLRQVLQPKVDTQTGELRGAEALVRWQHPTRGFISPAEFIPFAENTGRIRDVTRWMLRRALANQAGWPRDGRPGYLAVNISTLDLADDELPRWLAVQLQEHGVEPARLQLEVTESGLMAAGTGPVQVLERLRELGLRLAIDDFGTGQSSLAYLQKLPVDELKIDRSFVDRVDQDARRQYLLSAIVDLGHSLGLKVTAEGVETVQELAVLQRAGADILQGYLVCRPLDEAAFHAWQPKPLPTP
jgi:diguanylate cyclase (GGDEF)-like protein